MNIKLLIQEKCFHALKMAFPEYTDTLLSQGIDITTATQEKFGHYQCNSAMKWTKVLNLKPREIAEIWVKHLEQNNLPSPQYPLFAKIDIAGPGFINFYLNTEWLAENVLSQLMDQHLGVPFPQKPLKVIIDFSSPNTAKEMHVGHLRTTIIGDCIARLLTFMGHDVLRLNHIGDWGTQFGMLITHLKKVLPDIMQDNLPNVELSDLMQWYRDAKLRFDAEPEFKKEAQLQVIALQSGDPTALRIWEHICEISRRGYQKIYDLLDIDIRERGESFYNPYLSPLMQDLEARHLITLSQGAKCMILDGFVNRDNEALPLILQKSDGGYNYATTDLAALKHRIQDEHGDWIIYVVDAGQSLHLNMVFKAAEKAGFYDPTKVRLDHVPFGLVLKEDGTKFKTRSGDTEKLIDLIHTAISQAKKLLKERDPNMPSADLDHTAHILGINAIKYADLSCHRMSDYIFSYEKMLKFEGNTAAFLLYAYVRIQSIQRKIGLSIHDLIKAKAKIELKEATEIALGLLVAQFPEVLQEMSKDLLPSRLTDYLFQVANRFHAFFHQCRVEGSEQQNSRLLLIDVVGNVLKTGFHILGLKPLDKM